MIKSNLLILIISLLIASSFAQLSFPLRRVQNQHGMSRFLQKKVGINNIQNSQLLISIQVGKSKTKMNVQLDTGSYVLWFVSKSCQDIENYYPNRYNCISSDGCTQTTTNKDITFGDGTKIAGVVSQAPVYLEDGTLIDNQYFLYVTTGENVVAGKEDGIFGLGVLDPYNQSGKYKNWVNNLFSQNLISANQFSLYLDDALNTSKTQNSQLILGNVDEQFILKGAKSSTFAVTSREHWSITASEVSFGDTVVSKSSIPLLIDSGTSFIALPGFMLASLKQIMKDQYSIDYDSKSGAFIGSCDKRFPEFSFKLIDIDNKEVTITLEAEFYSLYDKTENQCGFFIIEVEDEEILLGDGFMMKYLSTFKYYPSLQVSFAQSITEPPQIPFKNPSSSDKSFPVWAIIIICVVSILLVGLIIYFFYRRYQKIKLQKEQQQSSFQQQLAYKQNMSVTSVN